MLSLDEMAGILGQALITLLFQDDKPISSQRTHWIKYTSVALTAHRPKIVLPDKILSMATGY